MCPGIASTLVRCGHYPLTQNPHHGDGPGWMEFFEIFVIFLLSSQQCLRLKEWVFLWLVASEPFGSLQAGSAGPLTSAPQLGVSLLFAPCPSVQPVCSFCYPLLRSRDWKRREAEKVNLRLGSSPERQTLLKGTFGCL